MNHLIKGAALICFAALAAPAHAITVGLNNGTVVDGSNTATFSQSGISGTITAGCDYPTGAASGCGTAPTIQANANGLGVVSAGDQNNQLDNRGNAEFLTFSFNANVSLFSITLVSFAPNSGDRFDLYINGTAAVLSGTNTMFAAPYEEVSTLTIVATNDGTPNGNFRLAGFDVLPSVPVPAGGTLLASGLFGAFAFGRRRRA